MSWLVPRNRSALSGRRMSDETSGKRQRRRRWWFPIVAVLIGLVPLVVAEMMMRAGDWGEPGFTDDPFVSFDSSKPLFELNDAGDRYEISSARQDWFYPVTFPAQKSNKTFRAFCIGGSTVAGRPYTVETAFSSWLQIYLKHIDPERDWEIVNCGGVSYASYRLEPIVREVLAYEPDLIILYTGHNEFLEDRTYQHVKNLPKAVTRPYEVASKFRVFSGLRQAYLKISGKTAPSVMEARPILANEVDALLEHEGGLEQYFRDEAWTGSVIEHFGYNIHKMLKMAKEASVPVIVMNPVSNLRDTPPFKSEHRTDITEDEIKAMDELGFEANRLFTEGRVELAVENFREMLEIDDQYADLHYQLARAYEVLNIGAGAREAYGRAKDLDIVPLRMLEPMHAVLRKAAQAEGASFLDTREAVNSIVENGVPGNREFLDHVHPNVGGHQFFAKLLVDEMVRLGLVKSSGDDWLASIGPSVQAHMKTLPDGYWADGEIRLENLRQWARGNSKSEPPVSPTRRNPRVKAPAE